MSEQVAIIRNVKVGHEDHYGVALWFDTYISEGIGALQVIPLEQAKDILGRYEDMKHLEGKPCWVENDGTTMRFIRLWDQ